MVLREHSELHLLLVEDSEDDAALLMRHLNKSGLKCRFQRVETENALIQAIEEKEWDVFICDYNLPTLNALTAISIIKKLKPDTPCLVVSGSVGEDKAVEIMLSGASDYIMKDKLDRLVPAIHRELLDVKALKKSKRLEEALKKSEENLFRSQKFESIGQLAGGIAHDFNNILAVIMMQTESLRDAFKSATAPNANLVQARLEEIRRSSERGSNLTRQLLTFSRKQVIQPRVLNLNDVVRDMHTMVSRLIEENVQLFTDLSADLKNTKIDPGQVEQILVNLVVNARDAMPRGGSIRIETRNVILDDTYSKFPNFNPGPFVQLSVVDTGSGMDPQTQERVFDPFFTTKPVGKGTGLGLSTVYGIVQQNMGIISVESQLGEGTTFQILFPATEEATEVQSIVTTPSPQTSGRESVLVVEDEPALNALICETLKVHGYRVMSAANGSEALLHLEKSAVHLILTDVVMPKMGGPELARHAHKINDRIKILFQSGYLEDTLVKSGVESGHIHFLEKPYSLNALLQKVRSVLDQEAKT